MKEEMKRARQLAEEHWKFFEGFWESLPDDTMYGSATIEYLYKEAMVHGYKHCLKDLKAGTVACPTANGD